MTQNGLKGKRDSNPFSLRDFSDHIFCSTQAPAEQSSKVFVFPSRHGCIRGLSGRGSFPGLPI